jgi:four helix bundle protein
VWQLSKTLSLGVYRVSAVGPFSRDFALRDQIRRAAISVMSNIAEGFERYSRPEFSQFLSIARGSAAEVRSQLYLARELQYINESDFQQLHNLTARISRMLASLRTKTLRR